MHIKNNLLRFIFRLMVLLTGTVGLLDQTGVFEGGLNSGAFNYYTVLSNLLCAAYFALDLTYLALKRDAGKTTWHAPLKGLVTMTITVTMAGGQFVLGGFAPGWSSVTVHYIVPTMVILDWLLFDKKGFIRKAAPLVWTLPPLLYFGYVMTAAQLGARVGYDSTYPYPFLDVDALGWGTVFTTVFELVILIVVLGYAFFAMDRILFALENRNRISRSFKGQF